MWVDNRPQTSIVDVYLMHTFEIIYQLKGSKYIFLKYQCHGWDMTCDAIKKWAYAKDSPTLIMIDGYSVVAILKDRMAYSVTIVGTMPCIAKWTCSN